MKREIHIAGAEVPRRNSSSLRRDCYSLSSSEALEEAIAVPRWRLGSISDPQRNVRHNAFELAGSLEVDWLLQIIRRRMTVIMRRRFFGTSLGVAHFHRQRGHALL